jgi:hypothetical protein
MQTNVLVQNYILWKSTRAVGWMRGVAANCAKVRTETEPCPYHNLPRHGILILENPLQAQTRGNIIVPE